MKGRFYKVFSILLILMLTVSLIGCKDNTNSEINYIVDIEKTETIGLTDIYTIYYSNGTTERFEIVNGSNGIDGKPGSDGIDGKPGINGVDGKPGIDGKTPYIGSNGNWFIGDKDTGISAMGQTGKPGANGQDGKPGANAPHYGEKHNVKFILNGSTFVEEQEDVVSVNWGNTINLPVAYKYGHAFMGWFLDENDESTKFSDYDAVFRDLTLYAKFVPGSFKVTLDLNGGSYAGPTEYFYTYNSRYELPTNITKENYIFSHWSLNGEVYPNTGVFKNEDITLLANYKSNVLTCREAIEKAKEIGDNANPSERFLVSGKVKEVIRPQFGEMTIYDETGELYLFDTYSADGELRYSEMPDKPYKGDKITVSTTLNTFNGEPQGKSAWIQSFEHVTEEDDKIYTKMSIKEARNVLDGSGVELTGTVAFKTLGQSRIENGFYLIDGEDSIYIFDNQIAPRVQVGNIVTIKGTKEMFISEMELNYAEKFGYTGSCQVSNVRLVENDNEINKLDLSFAEEITIKNLINKPYNENYRTKIYKTNAYINRSPGNGFVNYFITDLDNQTGSYVFTYNGGEFKYLDEFDGKICTVYISVINMKSTATGCVPRFIPILVEDNNYKFDLESTNQFVFDYYIKDNFLSGYSANPSLELVTSVSQKDLGFENVEVKYESQNPEVLTIDSKDGKTIMNTKHDANSTAIVKVTITFNGKSLEKEIKINLFKTPDYKKLTVKQAIDSTPQEYENADTCEKIIVKGVAGPSLVNQVGFYLIDETGVIAVKTTTEVMAQIKFGDLVTLEGIRAEFNSRRDEFSTKFQSCLLDANLLLNEYGNHNYSNATFDNTKTLADLVKMAEGITSTTQVYVVKAKVEYEETSFYTKYNLVSTNEAGEKVTLNLYSATSIHYNWLKEFAGKGEITMEIALCNYNGRNKYFGAVLSVNDGSKTVYNLNNYRM